MARRHSGASPTQQRKSPTEETGNNDMLSASLPDFGRKRASSFTNLAALSREALIVPSTSPIGSRTFNRSRSHSGSDLRRRTQLPEIRISSNDVEPQKKEVSDDRRHTVPVVQVSQMGSDRRRYTAPSIQISPPKKTSLSQKGSPLLKRNVVQPSPPQTPSPADSPKSLSPECSHKWQPTIQRMRSTPAVSSHHSLGGSRTPPLTIQPWSPSANKLSCSPEQNRLTRSFSDLRTANLSRPTPPAKVSHSQKMLLTPSSTHPQQLTLEEQFEQLKNCRYLRQPSENSLSKSQEYLSMSH